MWLCYTNNIYLLFLPPHTSHVLQPLDQSVFSPVKAAYRKELGYLSQWIDSTAIGKRNFISCYQKARLAGLTAGNIKSGWKYTGLWPVAIAKPLMNGLLVQKATSSTTTPSTPSTPLNKVARDNPMAQNAHGIDCWALASSAVKWSTPRKVKDLGDQLHIFSQLEQSIATQRQLFRKVKKGFQEQSFALATAQQKIELLEAKVANTASRKRKAVELDPNTKFATIKEVRQAQIEAGVAESD
ncbi:transposase [Colletotrichum chrysophilum]|uniref:Transposase n=1 Tax=Colletotrichum chrysophilum TaxID=1836956 RepID=A0AAD9A9F7_9PEZI|nr:transposase [Colletotrichum chrysophilum]